jgi:uroporphyrinogen-III synthase
VTQTIQSFLGLISSRIIEEFRGLAWSEVKPKYIDHEYCQILLIGEQLDSGVEPTTKDKKHDKETPQEELEKLEHEDELRVEHLHGKLYLTASAIKCVLNRL